MASYDELAEEALRNEPGFVPPREPLRIRVSPYDTPPPSDTGWGGFGAGGRPTGRLFEPDLEPVPPPAGAGSAAGAPQPPWQGGRLFEPDQSPAPPKPQFQPGLLSLGNVVRGIGALVQGAGGGASAPAQPAAPPAARDPTAGPRQMFQQGYPSAPYKSMFEGPATTALEASGIPEFIESGKGYFAPESVPGEQQQRAQQQVQTGANVTANLAGFGVTGASIRGGTSLGVFGGRIEPGRKAFAERLEAQGASKQEIWKQAGVSRFADGQWRQEIPDIAASYRGDADSIASRIFDQKYPDRAGKYQPRVPGQRIPDIRSQTARQDALLKIQQGNLVLGDVIPHHPELYSLYPEVRNMPVSQDAHMQASGGYYARHKDTPEGKIVYREEPDKHGKVTPRGITFKTLIHEIDHAIANIEGFAKGSNATASNVDVAGSPARILFEKRMNELPESMRKDPAVVAQVRTRAAHEAYNASAGEKSAAITDPRADMTREQLAAIEPTSMMRPRLNKQIVEYNKPYVPEPTQGAFEFNAPQSQMGGVLNPRMQMSAGPSPLLRSPGKTMKEPAWQPVTPTPFLKDPQRTYSPGIYKNPKQIAEEAGAQTAAEHPALKALFGVTRDDLWQIGGRGARQGNVDPQLWAPNKPGGSYVARNIMTPENAQRMIDPMVEARRFPALSKGMEAWYVMDPAFQRMVQLVGKEQAIKDYKRFNAIMTPFSSNSTVTSEINRGTAARMMAEQGRFPEFAKHAGTPVEKRGADFPSDLRDVLPHLRHGGHIPPVERWLKTGEHGYAKETVKNPLYTLASGVPETGFQTKLPVPDAHLARASGAADVRTGTDPKGWGAYLGGTEYREFGPWFRENVAKPLGVEAVPGQGLMWGTFAPQTGVKTAIGAPKLEILSQLIWERAHKLGIDPKKLRDDILMGKGHALWLIGVPAAGAGAAGGMGSVVDPKGAL